jgi:TetR/AcrR family transcriptional repressor of mexCD-oprJ operon
VARADAQRNLDAIVAAAVDVLAARPEASMTDIARAAGVTRQTVYAHFPSRARLLEAVLERAVADAVARMDASGLDDGAPQDVLARLVHASWRQLERHARLLEAMARELPPRVVRDRHAPVLERLERLVDRGRREGVFTREVPVSWLVAAYLGLVHAAGEEVASGRLAARDAEPALQRSVRAVLAA